MVALFLAIVGIGKLPRRPALDSLGFFENQITLAPKPIASCAISREISVTVFTRKKTPGTKPIRNAWTAIGKPVPS